MVTESYSGELQRGASAGLATASSLSGRLYSSSLKPQTSGRSPLPHAPSRASSDASGLPKEHEDAYFSELLSYSLDRLGKEPELLAADQAQLKRSAQEAAVTHYRAFISAASCLREVQDELEGVSGGVDALLDHLPTLASAGAGFGAQARELLAQRAQNKQLQGCQGVLLELLEVAQLMDTCVRSGSYDDALDLRGFINKLAVLHGGLGVVALLEAEVAAASAAMLQQLLGKLRGSIQLPECLRVIGYLRRLAAFSEHELRLQFLSCREAWFAEVISELDSGAGPATQSSATASSGGGGGYEYLKRLTDAHRLHLFDVVMQYRAIFSDDSSSQEASGGDGGLVYSWAAHRVSLYLSALARHLPRIGEGGSLASVLEHCMYCGMSLARVGLDFRGLLAPIFEACILNLFSKAVNGAVEGCLAVLEVHKWAAMPSAAARQRRQASLPGPTAAPDQAGASGAAAGGAAAAAGGPDLAPPYELMEHVPLALLVNGLLGALNELRHCAALSLARPVVQLVQEALQRTSGGLAHYGATRMLQDPESELFTAACRAHAQVVAPYIAACLRRIYPPPHAGLDIGAATAPLKPLLALPARPPPPAETPLSRPSVGPSSALPSSESRAAMPARPSATASALSRAQAPDLPSVSTGAGGSSIAKGTLFESKTAEGVGGGPGGGAVEAAGSGEGRKLQPSGPRSGKLES